MEQNIDKQNETIALYVGAIFQGSYPNGDEKESHLYHYGDKAIVPLNWCRTHSHTEMKYNTSFDWLMPVVTKLLNELEEISFGYEVDGNVYSWRDCYHNLNSVLGLANVTLLHRAVVLFIEWHNAERKDAENLVD